MGEFLQAMQQGGQQSATGGQSMGTGTGQNSGMTGQGSLSGGMQQGQPSPLIQMLIKAMQQQGMKGIQPQQPGQSQQPVSAGGAPSNDPNVVNYQANPLPMGGGNAGYGMGQGYQGQNNGSNYPLIS